MLYLLGFNAGADVAETEAAFRDDLRLPAAFDEYAAFSARFSEKAFALCGYPFQAYCDIRNPQRGAYYARHIGLIEEAVAALRRARAALPRVRRAAESRLAEYFEAEERILRITDAEIRLLLGQMRRQYALAAGDIDTKQAKRYLAVIGRKLKTVLDIAADVPAAVKGVSGKGFFAELGTVHRNVYGDTLRDNNVHFPIGAMCDGSHV